MQNTVLEVVPLRYPLSEKKEGEGGTENPAALQKEEENAGTFHKETGGMENPSVKNEEEADGRIRVVLLGEDGVYHKKIVLEADNEKLEILPDCPYFVKTSVIRICAAGKENGSVRVMSLQRACGTPSYQGILEIRKEEAGLILINEVGLEEYVKGVLPGEMPSSYPPEALKAQAVCARTYAMMKQREEAYPQYDAAVDDSTACQVYRNLDTSIQGDAAVEATAGEVLIKEDGSFAECYYYSTSCGLTAQISVWHGGEQARPVLSENKEETAQRNNAFFDYISQRNEEDIEAGEAFYRWEYKCEKANAQKIFERCRTRQALNPQLIWAQKAKDGAETKIHEDSLGNIKTMEIAERQEGGVADCLKISCAEGELYVWGEYNIRYVLAQGGEVKLQNGSFYQAKELLPSAFISLQSICNKKGNMIGYTITGGGFGHGVGLSQNGAKQMAAAGRSYLEILRTYYEAASIVKR